MSPSEKWVWQFLYIQKACIIFYHVYPIEICHEFHSTKPLSYLWPIFCQTKFGQSMIFGCHKHESKEEENGFLFIFGVENWRKGKSFCCPCHWQRRRGHALYTRNSLSFFLSPTPKPMLDYANAHTHKNTLEEGWSERWEEASKGSFQERDE